MAFTPHPSANLAVRSLQRTMYIQVAYAVVFGAINAANSGATDAYGVKDGPPSGLVFLQFALGAAILGCAIGLGKLATWSRPASYAVEIANLGLGVYALTNVHSPFVAGFILSIYALVKVSSSDVTQCLQRGPVAGMTNGYPAPPPGTAPYGTAPYGTAPYGTAPYGTAPYGTAPYGTAPYGTAPYGYGPPQQAPQTWPSAQQPYTQPQYGAPYGQAPAPWPGQPEQPPAYGQAPPEPPR